MHVLDSDAFEWQDAEALRKILIKRQQQELRAKHEAVKDALTIDDRWVPWITTF